MRVTDRILLSLVVFGLGGLSVCIAQAKPDKAATAEYLRGKLIGLSTKDDANGILDVSFDQDSCVMTITNENHRSDRIMFGNLNATSAAWDIFDPSTQNRTNPKLLRLTFVARSGADAITLDIGTKEQRDRNFARLMFSLPKAAEIPGIQSKISHAANHLITLCGGISEKDPF